VPLRGHVKTWMAQGRFGEGSDWFQQRRYLACVAGGYQAVFEVPMQ